MNALLKLARVIDFVNDRFGVIANWLVLLACLISAGNAASRQTPRQHAGTESGIVL